MIGCTLELGPAIDDQPVSMSWKCHSITLGYAGVAYKVLHDGTPLKCPMLPGLALLRFRQRTSSDSRVKRFDMMSFADSLIVKSHAVACS
jgi:hypothetical protein